MTDRKTVPLSLFMWVVGGLCSIGLTVIVGISSYYRGQRDLAADLVQQMEKRDSIIAAEVEKLDERVRQLEIHSAGLR